MLDFDFFRAILGFASAFDDKTTRKACINISA